MNLVAHEPFISSHLRSFSSSPLLTSSHPLFHLSLLIFPLFLTSSLLNFTPSPTFPRLLFFPSPIFSSPLRLVKTQEHASSLRKLLCKLRNAGRFSPPKFSNALVNPAASRMCAGAGKADAAAEKAAAANCRRVATGALSPTTSSLSIS